MVKEIVTLSEKLFLMHAFVLTTVDDIHIMKVKTQDEKPKYQSVTLGSPFYKQIWVLHRIFDETLLDHF